ncbi:hypothetical protein DENSPDRAFT_824838 [Dentipellis sp. KUC8613]|nr:hypothetical protein DENSPDRAFT_824838 [Dentipellis sp. KUC8613]
MARPLILYDIPTSSPRTPWSPNPWKARLALNAKSIQYRTVWVEYPDIAGLWKRIGLTSTEAPAGGPLYTLPVLENPNTGAIVSDSFKIARYLDEIYPDSIRLMPNGTEAFQAMFIDVIGEKVGFAILKAFIGSGISLLNPPSREYFRRTREEIFGMKLEEITPEGPERDRAWKEVLEGLTLISKWEAAGKCVFMMGDTPSFADIVMLSQLQWIKTMVGTGSKEWKDVMVADGGRWASLYQVLERWASVDEGTFMEVAEKGGDCVKGQ